MKYYPKKYSPIGSFTTADEAIQKVCERADYLAQINAPRRRELWRIKAIVNGGAEGIRALLGSSYKDTPEEELALLPAANFLDKGLDRFAQRAGRLPTSQLEPPKEQDSDPSRKRTEKLLRITSAFDEQCRLEMAMPQVARWLFGYAFVPFVIGPRMFHGEWYPYAELRDPYECDPAPWGPQQQPTDLAFRRIVPAETLCKMYPHHAEKLKAYVNSGMGMGTTTTHNSSGRSAGSWENPQGKGVEITEYMDCHGTWVVISAAKLLLEFQPVPEGMEHGAFAVLKKFSFDKLKGNFDSAIGLAAAMTRINIYLQAAIEDSIQVETNVSGVMEEFEYLRGRGAVNFLPPGATVDRPASPANFQAFQQVALLERQLRIGTGYDASLDGDSPSSFITGKGVQELRSGFDAEVREVQTACKWGLQDLTARLLEYDEKRFNYDKPLVGQRKGQPFEERYTPGRDIKGQYWVRRAYGAMAGFDDPAKVATGANLVGIEALSLTSLMENIDGLDNVFQEKERIRQEKAEQLLFEGLAVGAQQGDPRALMVFVDMLPEGDRKQTFKKFYTPEEPQMSPEEEAFINGPPPAPPTPGNGLPTQPPDVQTVLSRVFGDSAETGVQTVGRI